jgi:two-component system LytT family response regulator
MMIRALIADDEPLARSLLRELLAGDPEVQVVTECGTGQEAVAAVRRARPDLLFLDVQMPGMSGMEVLGDLAGEPLPYVIFVTAHHRYAIEAFEKQALDYLLKPFSKERFRDSLERAKRSLRHRELADLGEKELAKARADEPERPVYTTRLRIRRGRRLQVLDVADVRYFQAASQYVRAHGLDESHLLSRSLTSLEKELDPQRFCRIHRSTLVNTAFVQEVRLEKNGACSVLMTGGERLRLSRRRRAALDRLLERR